MGTEVLLCSDLDRTLLPNGPQDESPRARERLRAIAERPELTLAYVSGRHRQLLLDAIDEYNIPVPDYAIGDVGTTIYQIRDGDWLPWAEWEREIAVDWNGQGHDQLAALFDDLDDLEPQEPEKQNTFKLSYYAPADLDSNRVIGEMSQRLHNEAVRASLIWSVDETENVGLLDVLPRSATKYHAIRFLMQRKGFAEAATVFAGDSGNDLPVLTSAVQSVLVRNARDEVREQALREARANGTIESLYFAKGGFLGMNGNYAAGALEGLVHFIPAAAAWLE
ncbi:MAG: HAD-IIB family hydrolase [Gammaproteobacteria bacterium]